MSHYQTRSKGKAKEEVPLEKVSSKRKTESSPSTQNLNHQRKVKNQLKKKKKNLKF